MEDKELNDKYNALLQMYCKKSNKNFKKSSSILKTAANNKNEKIKYIFKILSSFNFTNNKISIKNQNYKIFFSEFLDISKKIIADDEEINPEIIIKNDDLEKLGEYKKIIQLYIKIASLFKGESLQILFNFLNQNYTALNLKLLCFRNLSDFTNVMLLEKIYRDGKITNRNSNENKNEFEIKIILEEEKKKEDGKSKENENNQMKDILKEKTDSKNDELKVIQKKTIEEETKKKEVEIKDNININQKVKDDNQIIDIPLKKKDEINEPKFISDEKKEEFISSQSNGKIKINNQNNIKEAKELVTNNNNKEIKQEFDLKIKSAKKIRAKSYKYDFSNKKKVFNLYDINHRSESEKKNKKTNLNKTNNNKELIERISNLKKDLSMTKKVGVYLKEQKEKYLQIYKNNDILNNENFSKSLFDLNFHNSKSSKNFFFKKAAKNLKEYFNRPEENYNKNFGFAVLNDIAYFYLNDTEEQENTVLFDSEKIKKADYGINEKKDDIFSYASYSSSNKSKSTEEKEVEYQLINGIQFEKNFVDFFDLTFKLQHLPSIFFSVVIKENTQIDIKKKNRFYYNYYPNYSYRNINNNNYYYNYYNNYYYYNNYDYKKKNQFSYYNNTQKNFQKSFKQNRYDDNNNKKVNPKKQDENEIKCELKNITNDNKITFKEYINNLFKVYIETDLARFNDKNNDIKYSDLNKPFIEYTPFKIKKNDGVWIVEEISDKTLNIYSNSIVLAEAKLSAPDNHTYIKLEDYIEKNKIQNYLYFVIYKLTRKITYYKELFINEYLMEKNNFSSYKFQLFLVYNTQPYSNINEYIKKCIENLIKDKLIENEFIFQVLYLVPAMSRYNSKILGDIIKRNEKEIQELKEKDIKKDVEIQKLKEKDIKKDVEIQELIEKDIKKDVEIQELIEKDTKKDVEIQKLKENETNNSIKIKNLEKIISDLKAQISDKKEGERNETNETNKEINPK